MSTSSSRSPFTSEGVRDYERRRYRGLDQRLVQARERRILDRLFRRLEAGEAGEGRAEGAAPAVLDVPSGYGRYTEFLAGRGYAVTSADLSPEMVRRAVERGAGSAGSRPGFGGVVADAAALPFKPASFRVVFSVRLFHHLHDPAARTAILAEFRRATGGWAVVSFYRTAALHAFQRRVRRLFGKSRARIRMIGKGEFEREAEAAGFEVARIVPLFRGLHAGRFALLRKKGAAYMRRDTRTES